MLVEKMSGTSPRRSVASPEQRAKIIDQLAAIFIELRKHSFDKMGCLVTPDSHLIGAFARESLTDYDGSQVVPLGPHPSLQEYHTSSVKLILDLILQEEMYSSRSIDAYLIH